MLSMQGAMKLAMRALIEMYFLDMSTRNIMGVRPQPILDAMNPRFAELQAFAYDTPQQRDAAFVEMRRLINAVEAPFLPRRQRPNQTRTLPSLTGLQSPLDHASHAGTGRSVL